MWYGMSAGTENDCYMLWSVLGGNLSDTIEKHSAAFGDFANLRA